LIDKISTQDHVKALENLTIHLERVLKPTFENVLGNALNKN